MSEGSALKGKKLVYGLDGFEGMEGAGGTAAGEGLGVFFASITFTRMAASLVRGELG